MLSRPALLACWMAALTSVSAAQDRGPDTFGTQDPGITMIGYQEFFPDYSQGGYTGLGERTSTSSLYRLQAGINMIPNGAILKQVVFYVRDNDAEEDLEAGFCRTYVDSGTGSGNPIITYLGGTAQTNGSPGATYVLLTPDVPIVYRTDLIGDDAPEVANYFLRVHTPGNTAIRMARLLWERQVSPAPASATFGDVPSNHPFFQFIEALADSGITAGCGSGNYCPDTPVTRGQMAVFLAKALGLHWPWDLP